MKYLLQFTIILFVSLLGELLHSLLPFPFPASIYGLVLMLLFLKSGLIQLSQVQEAGAFLLEIMPVLFVPPAIGLINVSGELADLLIPLLVIASFSTVVVMVATGKSSDFIIRHKKDERSSS